MPLSLRAHIQLGRALFQCAICCKHEGSQGSNNEQYDQHHRSTLIIIAHVCPPQDLNSAPLVHEECIHHEQDCDWGDDDSSILQADAHIHTLSLGKHVFPEFLQCMETHVSCK